MRKRTLNNEYVSAFCLEMSLLLHAGISTEDGLYLLSEDESDKKNKKMLTDLANMLSEGRPLSEALREVGRFPKYVGDMVETGECIIVSCNFDASDVSDYCCPARKSPADFQSGICTAWRYNEWYGADAFKAGQCTRKCDAGTLRPAWCYCPSRSIVKLQRDGSRGSSPFV